MARKIEITITNNTGEELNYQSTVLNHGRVEQGLSSIPSGQSETFIGTGRDGSSMGISGTINFTGSQGGGAFVIDFNHPYGSAKTTLDASCPEAYFSKIDRGGLQHHTAIGAVAYDVR